MTLMDKACYERGCACYDIGDESVEVVRKEWVGLTDDEIIDMYNEPRSDAEMIAFGRELEAKLKEKNT